MSSKTIVMIGLFLGSMIGGYIPTLFGFSAFSYLSILGNAIGGSLGIYIGYKLSMD